MSADATRWEWVPGWMEGAYLHLEAARRTAGHSLYFCVFVSLKWLLFIVGPEARPVYCT